MADIFISYKKERRPAAEHLKRILEAHDYTVWYDFRGVRTGSDFSRQIEKELRAAKAAIVLWCGLAKESQWVREEAQLAKRLGIYVPVAIEPGEEPPLGFSLDQYVDLRGWDGSPRNPVLDALFDAVDLLAERESHAPRSALKALFEDWQTYGRRTC